MIERTRVPIDGMTCNSCASRITRTVRKIAGVESIKVDLGSDSAVVAFDRGRTSLEAVAAAVRRAGYEVQVDRAEPALPAKQRSLIARLGLGR
jgi:P-type Cu+ transporter